MFPVHADPVDYGRYTEFFWRNAAKKMDIKIVKLEAQGRIYSVFANMFKLWMMAQLSFDSFRRVKYVLFKVSSPLVLRALMYLDRKSSNSKNKIIKGSVTGYGIIFTKN
jgi:hypothetical protein